MLLQLSAYEGELKGELLYSPFKQINSQVTG